MARDAHVTVLCVEVVLGRGVGVQGPKGKERDSAKKREERERELGTEGGKHLRGEMCGNVT